ncbi:P-loop containing nucleoside triphosphate hydrolase protein [Lipomyces japonicus]|uniref:P-loop containing nucleoside triphosphate hydrolase protein n=1 Tax=Lipomyces japonicus TaxID=56871 RepID=UPI0034CF3EF9
MGKYRKRFNEKARSGTLARQKKLKLARQPRSIRRPEEYEADSDNEQQQQQQQETRENVSSEVKGNDDDPNAAVLLPMTAEEKAAKKAELEQLFKPPESKLSRVKRKRLDKYIERQLKREEKKVIMKKLSESHVDTSMLHSLKKLGTNHETRRETLQEALMKEKLGILDDDGRKLLYEEREVVQDGKFTDFFAAQQAVNHLAAVGESSINATSLKRLRKDDLADPAAQSLPPLPSSSSSSSSSTILSQYSDPGPTFKFSGSGFGFGSLQANPKSQPATTNKKKVPYNWRARLEMEKLRKAKIQLDDEDYSSTEGEQDDDDDDDSAESSEIDQGSDEEDEWLGFDEDRADNLHAQSDNEEDVAEGDENESDDDDDDDDDNVEEANSSTSKTRGENFKEWAENQMRGGTSEELSNLNTVPKFNGEYQPIDRSEDRTTPPPDIVTIKEANQRKSYFVRVSRDVEIQSQRLQLPVVQDEQRIMEAIHNNLCVVICGETGSGKTTQVPQFLLEAGYGNLNSDNPGMIGITQPRRVAAVSMAKRVSQELGKDHQGKVAYQIRFEQTTKQGTAMKFMTDGVLLRELATDFTLSKYSAIIIDEAHERNVNTDILIGVLSRVLKLRYSMSKEPDSTTKLLKLIIMSATLRVSDFSENKRLFDTVPPVLKVEARQYPVSVHFNRRTPANYLEEAYQKVTKIHQRLPPGGILVFLTGQNEISHLCKRLRKAFAEKKREDEVVDVSLKLSINEAEVETEDVDLGDDIVEHAYDLDQKSNNSDSDDEESEIEEGFEEQTDQLNTGPLHVLPLYSLLPTAQQMKIFEQPPENSRLCVIATNVAETSLTIPGIRYVVECGRVKERHFNEQTGVQRFDVSWISKASADQRSGRAGRTGPGHAYRLYSSAVFESEFAKFTQAEILRMPIDGVVLQMKHMGIDTIANFPFPTSPDRDNLINAEKLLHYLGALNGQGMLTELGKTMSAFPVAPRFAKMLVIGHQYDCLHFIIAIVAGLSVGDPFLSEHELGIETELLDNDNDNNQHEVSHGEIEASKRRRKEYHVAQHRFSGLDQTSDVLKMLSVICAYEYEDSKPEFCFNNFLRQKTMEEIHKLRQQLTHIVAINTTLQSVTFTPKLKAPSPTQVKALKQMISAGFIDQVVVRADLVSGFDESSLSSAAVTYSHKKRVRVTDIPYLRLNPYTYIKDSTFLSGSNGGVDKSCVKDIQTPVFIHNSSVLLSSDETKRATDMPPFLAYNVIQESSGHKFDTALHPPRIRIKPLTSIGGKQLANLCKQAW